MFLKAAAYKEYGKAAKIKLVVDALPKIAAEVAAPLEKVDDIVIVGGGSGSAAQILAELPVNTLPVNTIPVNTIPVNTISGYPKGAGNLNGAENLNGTGNINGSGNLNGAGIVNSGLKIAGGMKSGTHL